MTADELTLLTRIAAKDEEGAAATEIVLRGLVRTVPSEPGNLGYAVYQNDDDRSVFYILERWTTGEDAERHIKHVATDPTVQRSAKFMSAPPETVRVLPLGTTPSSTTPEGLPS